MSDYKEDVYLLGRPTNENHEENQTEQTNNKKNENTKFTNYTLNNKGKQEILIEDAEIAISIEHVDESQHKNEMTRRHSENFEKYKEIIEDTININEDSLSMESDEKRQQFVKKRSSKLNPEELEYVEYIQSKSEEYEVEEEKHINKIEREEESEYERQEDDKEQDNIKYEEIEEELENEEQENELVEESIGEKDDYDDDEKEKEKFVDAIVEEESIEHEINEYNDNNDINLEEKELSSKYGEISEEGDETTSECKNESITDQTEDMSSEHDEKIYNSNEPSITSEFEFHFRDQISDNFQMQSKGLFKLALSQKEPFFEDISNDPNEKQTNNETTKELQTHTINNDDKDRLIEDLRKQIVTAMNKYTEESEKLEEVQKENFEMEQLFKNKYYIDIQKEKDKLNEMIYKNKELLKMINEYKTCFEHINKKMQHAINTAHTYSKTKSIELGFEMLVNNMQHILIIMDSVKQKQKNVKYDTLIEDSFTPRFHNVGKVAVMLNEIQSNESIGMQNNLYTIDKNHNYKVTNLLQHKKTNSMEYQNNSNDLLIINNNKNIKNIIKSNEGAKKRNISNSSKISNSNIRTPSKIKERKCKKNIKNYKRENDQHLWEYTEELKHTNTKNNKNKMKALYNECKFNSFQNKCTLSTSSEDILNLFNKTRKFKYLLQTKLNEENNEIKTITRSLSKNNTNKYNKLNRKLSEKNYIGIPNKNLNIRMVPLNQDKKRTVSICLVPNDIRRKNIKNTNCACVQTREPFDLRKTIGAMEKSNRNELINTRQNSSIYKNINSSNPIFAKKIVNIELNPKINSCSNTIAITTSVLSTPKYGHINYLLQ